MENSRNELSDIVLEKGDHKTVKVKRILILAAFLILVFLVALASMKMMNKDNGKDTSKLILPPEPTQETQLPKDDQLFKQVPIIEENPKKESFEDMIKTLKEKEVAKQEEAKGKEPVATKADTTKVVDTKPKEATPPVAPKKEVAKPKETTTPTTSGSTGAGIFVQALWQQLPLEHRVLNDIKSKGFEYKIYPTVVNGNNVNKILIGPYANSADAENALANIRSSVNKNAFIYRIK